MIKYWFKLLNTDNCILKNCYTYLYDSVEARNEKNCVYVVKYEITRLGFAELWINQQISQKNLPIIKQRLLE